MSEARCVHAKALHVPIDRMTLSRVIREMEVSAYRGTSANDDTLPFYGSQRPQSSARLVPDFNGGRIVASGALALANILRLTSAQRKLLERRAVSITANEYRPIEGSEALIVMESERASAVALHEIGFSRIREGGFLASDRFYKVIDTSNGSPAVAWAGLERSSDGNSVYVHISVVATV